MKASNCWYCCKIYAKICKVFFYTVAKGYSTSSFSKPTPPLCHTPHGVAYWRELGEPPYHLKLPQKLASPPPPCFAQKGKIFAIFLQFLVIFLKIPSHQGTPSRKPSSQPSSICVTTALSILPTPHPYCSYPYHNRQKGSKHPLKKSSCSLAIFLLLPKKADRLCLSFSSIFFSETVSTSHKNWI